jgi:hypothetical protein
MAQIRKTACPDGLGLAALFRQHWAQGRSWENASPAGECHQFRPGGAAGGR